MRELQYPKLPLSHIRDGLYRVNWPSISTFWQYESGGLWTDWSEIIVGAGVIQQELNDGYCNAVLRTTGAGATLTLQHEQPWPCVAKLEADKQGRQPWSKLVFEALMKLNFDYNDIYVNDTYFGFRGVLSSNIQIIVRVNGQKLCLTAYDGVTRTHVDYDFLAYFKDKYNLLRIDVYQSMGNSADGHAELWINNELKVTHTLAGQTAALNTALRPVFKLAASTADTCEMQCAALRVYYCDYEGIEKREHS